MRLKWTRQVGDTFIEALEYCETYSTTRRLNTEKPILARVKTLEEFPLMGPVEPFLARHEPSRDYRLVIAGYYKIVYRVADPLVWICYILDTRADPTRLLDIKAE